MGREQDIECWKYSRTGLLKKSVLHNENNGAASKRAKRSLEVELPDITQEASIRGLF
jgi:hypothetical protein